MASSGESIYKWIAPVPVVPERPPMYKSSAAVVAQSKELVASTIRVKHAKHVMGSISTREEPLRAHSKDKTLNPYELPGPFKYPASNVPPVPRRDERPLSLPASGKSFVQQNAVDAIMAPRRAREKPAPVDWLKAPSFGKVPAYLDSVKQELEQERDLMVQMLDAQQMESEAASGAHTREMADDERHELIEALKRKWDTVNVRTSCHRSRDEEGAAAPLAPAASAARCAALTTARRLSLRPAARRTSTRSSRTATSRRATARRARSAGRRRASSRWRSSRRTFSS